MKSEDLLNRITLGIPEFQDIPHVFFSFPSMLKSGARNTAHLEDEFGDVVLANFVGGLDLDPDGKIVPNADEVALNVSATTYEYLGYMNSNGLLIRSDYFLHNKLLRRAADVPQLGLRADDLGL